MKYLGGVLKLCPLPSSMRSALYLPDELQFSPNLKFTGIVDALFSSREFKSMASKMAGEFGVTREVYGKLSRGISKRSNSF